MVHKISINKLGPIESCTLDLHDHMVFVGQQASGKSTLAKAIFFFRTIKDDFLNLMIRKATLEDEMNEQLHKLAHQRIREKFLQVFGSSWGMDMALSLSYHYDDNTFIHITLKESFDEYNSPNYIFIEMSNDIISFLKNNDTIISHSILDEKQRLKSELNALFHDSFDSIYIPAGRSLISVLASSLNYIYSSMDDNQKRSLDYCTQSYIDLVLRLKPHFSDGFEGLLEVFNASNSKFKSEIAQAKTLVNDIIQGNYKYQNGEEKLEIDNGHYVKINFTSSGQQEALWIVNILYYYLLQKQKMFFIIEEPESHLFPASQKSMIDFISLVANCDHSCLVTTHSPYVLGSYNNLLYAGSASDKNKSKVMKIIDKPFWIESNRFHCWLMEKGELLSCMDEDMNLIKNETIDKISMDINEVFDQLINILEE